MMGRGLERGADCLPNLDPGQNALLWCMQGTSTSHTYYTTLRPAIGKSIEVCIWHRSVNYAAGAIVKRCDYISMVLCAI